MVRDKFIALALVALLCTSSDCFAWGGLGHDVIDRTAVDALPDDGPVFLKKYVDYIAGSGSIPDTWRGESEPFSKIEEDPNHGWFREQFGFMTVVPRSRYEFVLELYREQLRIQKTHPLDARLMNVRWTGTLPFAAMEVYGHLVADMRRLRGATPGTPRVGYLQQTCAFEVAWLGHYIGDGAQPLHDSIQHDGWQGPNPNGYTRDAKIHGRFESQYVELIGLSEGDIQQRIGKPGHLDGDVFELVLAYLEESRSHVEDIYRLDKRNAFTDPASVEAREMVYSRTAAGARMLRDLVYRAWLESAFPVDSKLPNSTSEDNPRYNPQTGSAAATRSPEASGHRY